MKKEKLARMLLEKQIRRQTWLLLVRLSSLEFRPEKGHGLKFRLPEPGELTWLKAAAHYAVVSATYFGEFAFYFRALIRCLLGFLRTSTKCFGLRCLECYLALTPKRVRIFQCFRFSCKKANTEQPERSSAKK